jgi:hypothetical protein
MISLHDEFFAFMEPSCRLPPDRERGAAHAEEESADEQAGQGRVPGQPEVEHRHDGGQRDQREHDPAAEPFAPPEFLGMAR